MTEPLEELPTEQPNPNSAQLDEFNTIDLLRVINDEDRMVATAVERTIPEIAKVVDHAAEAVQSGGRIHSFGAGTSGRLAVLDASEMHPTFGVPMDLVQGHIAGGDAALRGPVEGAEDDLEDGARVVDAAGISKRDIVIALSASGRAPWCVGVLRRARDLGAFAAAITCNDKTRLAAEADVTIAVLVGSEVLTGSTRMKSGTAQKLALNMITTGAMVRAGFTYGNLMVGLTPTNSKLKDRARRLVRTITGQKDVDGALRACSWEVRVACIHLMAGIGPDAAAAKLAECSGSLRRALETG